MKNKQYSILWLFSEIACVALMLTFAILPMVTWLKIALTVLMMIASISIAVVGHQKALELIKQKNDELKKLIDENKQWTILDIYAFLGIQPQYKSNGELKDIFELLGIEREYDEEGNRIPTIYERLGINPLFNKEGVELPYVLRIKNRVNAFARAAQTAPLIYVPQSMRMTGQKPIIKDSNAAKQEKPIVIQIKKETKTTKPAAKKPAAKKPNFNYGKNPIQVKSDTAVNKYSNTKASGAMNLFSAGKSDDKNKDKQNGNNNSNIGRGVGATGPAVKPITGEKKNQPNQQVNNHQSGNLYMGSSGIGKEGFYADGISILYSNSGLGKNEREETQKTAVSTVIMSDVFTDNSKKDNDKDSNQLSN